MLAVMSEKKLSKILSEALANKHFSVERLQTNTGIPSHYLDSLLDGNWENLPAKPYVRGYLIALADELNLDEEELLDIYKKEAFSASGRGDNLPGNRFALPKLRFKLKFILIALAALAFLIYIITFSINSRTPYLQLINPELSSEAVLVRRPTIELAGVVEKGDSVFIAGEQVEVDDDGKFFYEYNLQAGLNTIEFRVKRFLGKEIRVLSQVLFERIQFPEENVETDEQVTSEIDSGAEISNEEVLN